MDLHDAGLDACYDPSMVLNLSPLANKSNVILAATTAPIQNRLDIKAMEFRA
jgi:hypothetical protein